MGGQDLLKLFLCRRNTLLRDGDGQRDSGVWGTAEGNLGNSPWVLENPLLRSGFLKLSEGTSPLLYIGSQGSLSIFGIAAME